jgi:uncharacterized protein (UPF0262 family)
VLRTIRLDEGRVANASAARREEWRVVTQDLLEDHAFSFDEPFDLEVWLAEDGPHLAVGAGDRRITMHVPESALAPHMTEYLAVCRLIASLDDEGAASSRLEALDMAKKVAHDDAAKTLIVHLAPLGPDLRTARRLFTLIVTLMVDTTTLVTLRQHRRRLRTWRGPCGFHRKKGRRED